MNIAIIGGGPAGFAAAITLARKKYNVTILEKNSSVLKKLLLTGNGKCNYFNNVQRVDKYHSSSDIKNIITKENIDKVNNFWNELGIIPIVKNGYFYPFSESSSSMKSALVNMALSLGVNIVVDREIIGIDEINGKVKVTAKSVSEIYDKVIIATGSLAYPKTGSTGFGYEVAKRYGINVVDVNPSLVQLITDTGMESKWKGIRSHVKVKYKNHIEEGEIQLTDYGVSGICVFNISRDISINLRNSKIETIEINFVPWVLSDLKEFLDERNKLLTNRDITELCDAFINYKLLFAICSKLKIDTNKTWDGLSGDEKNKLCNNLTNMQVRVVGTKGYDFAQVCSGGIDLRDLDSNLASKNNPNLYFVGEVLDLDGDCGGYNLTIAILSGILVGDAIC